MPEQETAPIGEQAVVMGASMAGLLAARALSDAFERVTIVERDQLPAPGVGRKAVPQVIGFLAMENGLFFAATSATYGMPMVVELGVALDVLVGMFIFGIFFFQIRETFDSLEIRHMEKLKED